jgi:hypothetical protein
MAEKTDGLSLSGADRDGSILAQRQAETSGPLPPLGLLMGATGDVSRMVSQMALVLQHFVRERCDNEPVVATALEQDWNRLASLLDAHAKAISEQIKRNVAIKDNE